MSRGQGWRFLEIGRHLERAVHTVTLLRRVFVRRRRPAAPRGRRCWRSPTASRPIAAATARACNPAPCSTCCCSTRAIRARWATSWCSWRSWSRRSAATRAPRAARADRLTLGALTQVRLFDVASLTDAGDEPAARAARRALLRRVAGAAGVAAGRALRRADAALLQPRRSRRSNWCASYEVSRRPHDALPLQPAGDAVPQRGAPAAAQLRPPALHRESRSRSSRSRR